MLVLSPECWCKDNQHTEYFQTTDEHHQRAEPFCHIRQFAPRHGWSDFRTQRRSHITHTTQGDGDGIGIVDAHGYHRERYHQTDDEISGEEGKQRNTLLHRYVHTINLQWQHGVRMQNLAEFILHHSYQHHATDTFQTSTRTARAGSEEHAGCQYHPGNVRPHSSIVVK